MRCHSWRASCDFDIITGSESQQLVRFGYVFVATRQTHQSAHTYGSHLRGKKFSADRPSTCLFLPADSVKCLSPSQRSRCLPCHVSGSLLSQEDGSDAFIAVAFRSSTIAWFRRENPSPQFQNLVFTAVHTLLEHTGHPGPGKRVTLKKRNCLLSFRNVFKQKLGALVSC